MTDSQIKAIIQLAGLRTPQTRHVARLMLTGTGPSKAAQEAGMSQPTASHVLARLRKVQALIKEATA